MIIIREVNTMIVKTNTIYKNISTTRANTLLAKSNETRIFVLAHTPVTRFAHELFDRRVIKIISRGDITTSEQQDGFLPGKCTTDTTLVLMVLAETYPGRGNHLRFELY